MSFSRLSQAATRWTGKPVTFALAVGLILLWALTGPLFGFSDTWQLVINTGTTIITFLMVFVLQSTQNRDSAAVQAKLDELIRSSSASNRFIGLDSLTDEEIATLRDKCQQQAKAPPPPPRAHASPATPWPEPWASWWGL